MTVTIKKKFKCNNGYIVIADVVLDSSYPIGGEAISAKELGLEVIEFVNPSPASGYVFEFDHTNKKLKAFYADYDAAADGALIEVPDTTDLSAVTVRLVAFGY